MAYFPKYTLCMAYKIYNSIQQYNITVHKTMLLVICLLIKPFPRCFGLTTAFSEKHRSYRQWSFTTGFNITTHMIPSYKYRNTCPSSCLFKLSTLVEIKYYKINYSEDFGHSILFIFILIKSCYSVLVLLLTNRRCYRTLNWQIQYITQKDLKFFPNITETNGIYSCTIQI